MARDYFINNECVLFSEEMNLGLSEMGGEEGLRGLNAFTDSREFAIFPVAPRGLLRSANLNCIKSCQASLRPQPLVPQQP
jgi:hypothetical protein